MILELFYNKKALLIIVLFSVALCAKSFSKKMLVPQQDDFEVIDVKCYNEGALVDIDNFKSAELMDILLKCKIKRTLKVVDKSIYFNDGDISIVIDNGENIWHILLQDCNWCYNGHGKSAYSIIYDGDLRDEVYAVLN